MLIRLFSTRKGELPVSSYQSHTQLPAWVPGLPMHIAASNQDCYFIFQELLANDFKVRFYQFGSKIKDTYTWVSDPMLTLRMGVAQSHVFQLPHLGKQVFHQRDYNLLYIPHFSTEFTLGSEEHIRFIDIVMTADYLRSLEVDCSMLSDFLHKATRGIPAKLKTQNGIASIELLRWTDKLMQLPALRDEAAYCPDHVIEQVLSTALMEIDSIASRKTIRLNMQEIDKLYRIAEFLESSEKNTAVQQLAEKFKISTYKLEKGFKEIFGYSVLQHRFEQKMRLALRLIDDKNLKSKQVAQLLQYRNPQSFSKAFKKRFGYAPYRNAPKS
jgi:AraC-like DNA-binding protein